MHLRQQKHGRRIIYPDTKKQYLLLQFNFSEQRQADTLRGYLCGMAAKFNWWVGAIFLLGCVISAWGIFK